jgi:hypothetical protein
MLLKVDGLDQQWEDGVASDWEGELGRNNAAECHQHDAPFAIQQLNDPQIEDFGSRQHEHAASNIQPADGESVGVQDDVSRIEQMTADGATYTNSLPYKEFRERLVIHFDILHRQRKIRWPTRKAPEHVANIISS